MENQLQAWEKFHLKQILEELKDAKIALTLDNIPEILRQTSFQVRNKRYPNKCPYYQKDPPIPCHPEVQDLNCFLCACPEYNNTVPEGACRINSKSGKWFYHPNLPKGKIWDCSDCPAPHFPMYVERFLRENLERLKQEFEQ